MQVAVCAIEMAAGVAATATWVTAGGTAEVEILTAAVPIFVESCVEAALTVVKPDVSAEDGAVYRPVGVIVPESADHVTFALKLPVPTTVDKHWLVWPGCTLAGTQDTVTEVMVEDCV